MKLLRNIAFITIALLGINSVNILCAMRYDNAEMNRQRTTAEDFNKIINSEDFSNVQQNAVNRSWNNFSIEQKWDVLNHMAQQGILSQAAIQNWPMAFVPQRNYEDGE